MKTKSWVVNFDCLTDEYNRLWSRILLKYPDAQIRSNPARALPEMIAGHILAVLNKDTSSNFIVLEDRISTIVESILTFIDYSFTQREVDEITEEFANRTDPEVADFVRVLSKEYDPVYSTWAVRPINSSQMLIAYEGDWRIAQWHEEHQVRHTEFGEFSSIDIDIYALFDIVRSASVPLTKHDMSYEEDIVDVVKLSLSVYLMDDSREAIQLTRLMKYSLGLNDIQRYEILNQLEQVIIGTVIPQFKYRSHLSKIDSFLINRNTVTIHFANQHKRIDSSQVTRFEIINAMNNGDYVPEGVRRRAGL